MKHKSLKWIGGSAILSVGIIAGTIIGNSYTVNTSSVTPGTVNDPVVTKSYVDEQIAKISSGGGSSTGGSAGATVESQLEVVTVPAGKKLMVGAGGEVVVRTGKAVAYSSDANGLSDVTEGVDIQSGSKVPTNHLIIFPRDGRGIELAPGEKTSLTVMVRGSYYLQ